jgi:MATE family multidrug resistance protein
MALQVGGLALKVPLSALLIHGCAGPGRAGAGRGGLRAGHRLVMWSQALVAVAVLRRDRLLRALRARGRGLHPPDRQALWTQLRLGVPMGCRS